MCVVVAGFVRDGFGDIALRCCVADIVVSVYCVMCCGVRVSVIVDYIAAVRIPCFVAYIGVYVVVATVVMIAIVCCTVNPYCIGYIFVVGVVSTTCVFLMMLLRLYCVLVHALLVMLRLVALVMLHLLLLSFIL